MIQIDDCRLLVTCCNQNGGLYLLSIKDGKYDLSKVLNTECRGIAKYGSFFVVVSNTDGLFILDGNLEIIRQKRFVDKLDFHGVAIKKDKAYIVETRTNSIGVYSLRKNMRKIDEIRFSTTIYEDCHINDLFIIDDKIFVSMFSYPYLSSSEGVIVEYSLKDKKVIKFIHDKLSQPHSVLSYENHLYYCESAKFKIKQNDKVIFNSLGYPRGLAINNQTMIVGQSESRHLDVLLKERMNILFDCGIYVHNLSTKLSSFIPIPSSEVYGILII